MDSKAGFTERLAGFAARHAWPTLGVWLLLLVGAFFLAGNMRIEDDSGIEDTQSRRAIALIEQMRGDEELTQEEFIVVEADASVDDASFAAQVRSIVDGVREIPAVTSAVSYLDGNESLRTADGRVALIPVDTSIRISDDLDGGLPILDVVEAANATPGFRVTSVGEFSVSTVFNELAEETFAQGEVVGIAAAVVIMLLVFGAAVAATLPILLALAAVFTAVGIVAMISLGYEVNTFTVIVLTMVGLAVGIDYSLFIVQRFREERDRGFEKLDAIGIAGATASRTVLFSGLAVAIALAGMLIMPDRLFKSFGIGAIVVVITAVAGALTLLPALLGLLGDRVNWLTLPIVGRRRPPESSAGFWGAVTGAVTAHPVISVVATSAVLLAATAPLLTIELGNNGVGILPKESSPRHAFELINEVFSGGVLTAEIAIDHQEMGAEALAASVGALTASLRADDFFGTPEIETNELAGITRISVAMKGDFSSDDSVAAVKRIRQEYVPAAFDGGEAEVLVGGATAEIVDSVEVVWQYLPLILGAVLTASFVLLLVVFRSIVVPLKAVVMNLLSVGAAYGLIVLVFQQGVGNELLGFPQTDVIESWIPLFLFAILFGLSMDYHVFLLSRIKERYDETGDNNGSVIYGLHSTAAIITGAALIMVAVFGGFALGPLSMFQQMGFGLAVAVILDATIIRMVLMPASMELLGDRNWYFPSWLEWVPKLSIEGARPTATVGGAPTSTPLDIDRS
jgi:RND superfamily putative drug exporter